MIDFCGGVAPWIAALIDREHLDSVGLDDESILAHLGTCSYCSAERHRLERTRDLCAGDDRAAEPPESIWCAIEGTLRREGIIAQA
jgi:hypothetical protein